MKTKTKIISLALILIGSFLNADSVRLYYENDHPFKDDSDYTNGVRLEYQHNQFGFFVEQLMYSPENLRSYEYIPGTHPYAGFLGVGANYFNMVELSPRLHWTSYYEGEIGMIGPSSLAEETQKKVHKIVGAKDPKGWKYQLHNEFEFQTVYWTGLEYFLLGDLDGWNLRIGDEVGGYLGTMQIAAGNNLNLKIGYNSNFSRRPSNIEIRASEQRPTIVYALVANESRWWSWNVFLDGNRDGDSVSVGKEIWTTCLKTGLGAELGRVELGWFVLFNSREYKTQTHTPNYMSFQIGYRF